MKASRLARWVRPSSIIGKQLVVVLVVSSWCSLSEPAAGQEAADPSTSDRTTSGNVETARFEPPPRPLRRDDRREAFEAGIEEVRRSGILESAIGVGDRAIDFELPEIGGRELRLSELWATGPVVLVYYRGGWCPYCNQYLSVLQKSLLDIHALDAQLVAVSPELPASGAATQEKNKLTYPLLSDAGNRVAREYGLVFRISDKVIPYYDQFFDIQQYNGDRSYELPLAATYVIDGQGTVRYAFLDADYKRRTDPQEVLAVLRRLKNAAPTRPLSQPVQGSATARAGGR